MLRLFPRNSLDAISSLFARSSLSGFFSPTGKSHKEIISAIRMGLFSKDQALAHASEEGSNLPNTATDNDFRRIGFFIDAIKACPSNSVTSSSSTEGAMLYILAKLSHAYCAVKKTTSVFDMCGDCGDDDSKSVGKTFSAQLTRPQSEIAMCRLLNAFVVMCQATSLSASLALCPFLEEVVYEPIHNGTIVWCVAFECVVIYLRMIESQGAGGTFNLSNIVFRAGGLDSIRAQALSIAQDLYPTTCFRSRGENPLGNTDDRKGPSKNYEGSIKGFNSSSKICCAAWNAGKPHLSKNVDSNGKCNFLHKCNQFVDDKGPGGQCLGDHPRSACTYDASHKCNKPVSA